jgi:predicted transposase YdaD
MSNLGHGLVEETIEEMNIKYELNVHKKNYSIEQIAEVAELDEKTVERIIEENSPAIV